MKYLIAIVLYLSAAIASGSGAIDGYIRDFIDNKPSVSQYKIGSEYLLSGNDLNLFYSNRGYSAAWLNHSTLTNNGFALVDYLRNVDQHGLHPEDYHLTLIEKYVVRLLSFLPMQSDDMMKLDVLLSDAYLTLGFHLYNGKVDPEKEGASWKMQRKVSEIRLDLKLQEALTYNNVSIMLDQLAPHYRSYWRMKEELVFFLKLENRQWSELKSDSAIKPGLSHRLIPEIRQRLVCLRYQLSDTISIIYDNELLKQVRIFQRDWGLNADGMIGKTTMEVLSSMPRKLINQLKVNMERFRWLPVQVNEKYIIVNIANFELDMIKGKDTLISMRAIVGKGLRETPVFNNRITYIVFSPSWTVPGTILKDDVIPELLKGPGYLESKKMKLLSQNGSELNYSEIDWTKISIEHFPYIVRQDPGPGNALGRVKFMFPNSYSVYIHDTPTRGFFARDDRAISSGCIRVEKPFDLAVLLLSDSPEWSPGKIRAAMKQEKEQIVHLKSPVDVILVYLTAWTDGSDRIQFRKDVYNSDNLIVEALNQKPVTERFISALR